MCLTLGLTRKQMIVEPAFKIIWHNDILEKTEYAVTGARMNQ